MKTLNETYTLMNHVSIPKVGFGTWQIKNGKDAYEATLAALKGGYRHIDTAAAYGNEESIGRAIKDSKIDRKELFITTKLPAEIKSYEGALTFFKDSLKKLDVDYIDLYLIHAPWPWDQYGKDCSKEIVEVWKAFEEFYENKQARSIGVSNFNVKDLQNILTHGYIKPMVNQICYFISNTQKEIVDFCTKEHILIEAYSPIATGRLLNNAKVIEIANKYKKSVPQICIRFCIENNTLPLPKSSHENHILSNTDIDFTIDAEDMEYLNSLTNIL